MKRLILVFSIMLIYTSSLLAQQKTITGVVTQSNDGATLPGVTILVKGTTTGTISNEKGEYSINVSEESKFLKFSFIGMKTKEIPIGNSNVINVILEPDNIMLDEVVVIGYGAVKKSDLTGSVSSLKVDKIKKVPVNSIDQQIQGRIPGVQVTQLSSQPGGATSIRIRGGNSIMAGNEPLYVIDGIPITGEGSGMSWIGAPSENALSSLNPNDIESIEVLKDASATAIYGARGANGVVLITTKRGKKGDDNITFEAYTGMQIKSSDIDVMNASQFAQLFDDAGKNANPQNYKPVYPDPELLGNGTDWQKEIFRDAPIQNYQITFSGGNEKTKYAVSADYFSQDGIIKGSDFERYSFRANLDRKVTSKLQIGTNLTLNHTKANTVPTDTPGGFFPGVVNTALTFSPTLPIFDENGIYTLTDPNADAWLDNPVAVCKEVDAINNVDRVLGNVFANYKFNNNLQFKSSIGLDYNHQVQDMYTPRFIYSGSWNDSQARYATSDFHSILFENTLTYNKTFNKIHKFNIVGGISYQEIGSRAFIDIVTGFPNDILGYYGISSAVNMPDVLTADNKSRIFSYLGRVNYNLKEKYLFTITSRIDGSSKFGKNNRYAYFPSAAFAWRMSEEDFIKNLNIFSNLKFRASYGISGNERIPNNSFIKTIGSSTYYFNNIYPGTGFSPDQPGNNDLKWETTQQFDIGFDMGFFNNRITLTSDYYYKKTSDLLYYADLPYTSGYSSYLKNIGELENKGLEIYINSENFVDVFKWNTNFNISLNKNKILDLKGKELYVNNDTYKLKIGNWAVIREGEEMGSFYGLESDGIWQLNEAEEAEKYGAQPGDFKYVDQNNDKIIDANDRKIIGHALPDFIWGITNSFTYKNFILDIFFQGSHGNKILNSNRFELESGNGLSNASVDMLNRWTPDNPSNIYPRANRNADYLHMSDRYLEDGSYIRLKSITLSYNLPSKTSNFLKLKNARIYVTAKNLLTITDYKGFDPEVGHFAQDNTRLGYDLGGYPSSKTYIFGIIINI